MFLWRSRGQKVKGRFEQIPPKRSDVWEVNAITARSSGCQWIHCQFGQVLRFTQTALTFRRVGVVGVTGKASILPNGVGCGEAQAHGMGWFLEQKGKKANGWPQNNCNDMVPFKDRVGDIKTTQISLYFFESFHRLKISCLVLCFVYTWRVEVSHNERLTPEIDRICNLPRHRWR